MNPISIKACLSIRLIGALACIVMAVWIAIPLLHSALSVFGVVPWYLAAMRLVLDALILAILGMFIWLAWRLWRRWDSSTVRWFTGIGITILLIAGDTLPMRWVGQPESATVSLIASVLAIPLLVIGAMIYSYASHRMILLFGLHDAADLYGQPLGHQSRIRAFAFVLGWAIFLAGSQIDSDGSFSKHPDSWITFVVIFGPAFMGYATYKLIIWYCKPRTRPSLPAGGFEVITNPSPMAQGPKELSRAMT